MTRAKSSSRDSVKFYPCFLDVDKIHANSYSKVAQVISNPGVMTEMTVINQLFENFRNVPEIEELFTESKIRELAERYYKYYTVIVAVREFAKGYLSPPGDDTIPRRSGKSMADKEVIERWETTIRSVYERYNIERSIISTILYETVLSDLLWNAKLDPNDPKIIRANLKRVANHRKGMIENSTIPKQNQISESSKTTDKHVGIRTKIRRMSGSARFRNYKLDIDEDGRILIKRTYESDMNKIFSKSLRLMKLYRSGEKIDDLKLELSKVFYINELIESKYIYNERLSKDEMKDKAKYVALRANILSAFKEFLTYVLSVDNEFDFSEYYENTPYTATIVIKREQIRGVRKLIQTLLYGA